jgi:hypothetical protein
MAGYARNPQPHPQPDLKTRTLTVTTPYWTARSRWVYRNDKWEPVIFDKELNFLKRLTLEQAKEALVKLGARYEWSAVEDRVAPVAT